jgi:hypothetical protein
MAHRALVAPFERVASLPRNLYGWTLRPAAAKREMTRILQLLAGLA